LSAPGCSKESGAKPGEAPAASATSATRPDKAAPTAQAAPEGKVYGDGVGAAQSVPIADILADPDAYAGKSVRVEGTVTDVCPKRGCWFEMAGQAPGEKMRFKVRDGVMVFPMDAKGSYAVAEGVVHASELTLEETREYMEYQAKEYGKDIDLDSITEPMTVVRLDGKGAVLRDAK
jgi:hypothetical protein